MICSHLQIFDAKLAKAIKSRTDIQIQLALYHFLCPSSLSPAVILGTGEVVTVVSAAMIVESDCWPHDHMFVFCMKLACMWLAYRADI